MLQLKFRGRPPILIADSVLGVGRLTSPYAQEIMDRNKPISSLLVSSVISQSVMSWKGRSPKPALDQDGDFQCTDLDLLSFLTPIAAPRPAIV